MQQHSFQSLGNISVDWELRSSSSFFQNRTIEIAMLQKQENPFIMKRLDKQSNYVEFKFCVVVIKESSHTFWFSRKDDLSWSCTNGWLDKEAQYMTFILAGDVLSKLLSLSHSIHLLGTMDCSLYSTTSQTSLHSIQVKEIIK